MNNIHRNMKEAVAQVVAKPEYQAPVVRVMSESEVLAAFQVNATSASMAWWAC